jgi:hypothetical protein
MIDVKLVGLTQLQANMRKMPTVLQDRLRIFMARFSLTVRDRVRANILERFKVVTGLFPEAVQVEQIETPGSITGRIFIDTLPWAAIQERGGKTSPHVIEPATANVLAFLTPAKLGFSGGPASNALVLAKRVNHPGSDIPERSYARLALVQMRAPFEGGIRQVVDASLNESFAVAAE